MTASRTVAHTGDEVEIDGRRVRLTSLDRVVWPLTGTTKRDLIEYLLAAAPALLSHLRGRPTMLWRFPEGIDGPGWFQAQCRSRPDWVPTHEVIGKRGERLAYCVIEEPATLAWLANLGTIEFHPFGWTVERPTEPTTLVLDLDPGPPAGLVDCARVALRARELLNSLALEPVVKTSGGLGLHVAVPLAAGQSFERAKSVAREIAGRLAEALPELVVRDIGRAKRRGRVYVDWIQNDANRQLVAAYSPRATPIPQVSTPLLWEEVEHVASTGRDVALRPTRREVLDRIERFGDLWLGEPRERGGVLPAI